MKAHIPTKIAPDSQEMKYILKYKDIIEETLHFNEENDYHSPRTDSTLNSTHFSEKTEKPNALSLFKLVRKFLK